jgi:hypothetical protein
VPDLTVFRIVLPVSLCCSNPGTRFELRITILPQKDSPENSPLSRTFIRDSLRVSMYGKEGTGVDLGKGRG